MDRATDARTTRQPKGRKLPASATPGRASDRRPCRGPGTAERSLTDYVAQVCERATVRKGVPLPLGTREQGAGVNFAFFSRHASRARLELFDRPEDAKPARTIELDPTRNRTGDIWHVWVEGIHAGQLYAYRVDGPYEPKAGHRFNFHKLLLDPYATAVARWPNWDFGPARGCESSAAEGDLACSQVDDAGAMPKCVFLPAVRWKRSPI
jgi:isoamylase